MRQIIHLLVLGCLIINSISTPLYAMQTTSSSQKQLSNTEIIKKIITKDAIKSDLLSLGFNVLSTSLFWAGSFLLMNKILLKSLPLSAKDHQEALTYAQQTGLNPQKIKIIGGKSPLSDIAQAIPPNKIVINPEWFSLMNEDEKKFLIGHESIHLLNNHISKRFAVVLSTTLAVKIYALLSHHIFEFLKQKYQNKNLFMQDIHLLHSYLLIPLSLIPAFLAIKYAQSTEKEADIESAKRLECAQAGKLFFTDILNIDKRQPFYIRYLNTFLNYITGHPSHQERINYLDKLAQEQAAQAA